MTSREYSPIRRTYEEVERVLKRSRSMNSAAFSRIDRATRGGQWVLIVDGEVKEFLLTKEAIFEAAKKYQPEFGSMIDEVPELSTAARKSSSSPE